MADENLTRPGEAAQHGDMLRRITSTGFVDYTYFENVEFPVFKPVMSKTQFFDALGDEALLEFIVLIDSGNQIAKLFNYRISQTVSIDMNHATTQQGLAWMVAEPGMASINQAFVDGLGW